jgi:antitoxin component YwqK of YwqJK toxin-antitoxin module
MKNIILTFTLLIVAVNISFAQDNKVDGKGLRKGEWIITYTGDFQFYDYMSKLLNLDKMLLTTNETDKEEDYRFFEKVAYQKGIKQGEFYVFSAELNNNGKYPLIAAGEYKDGEITGNVVFYNYQNQTRFDYQERLCTAIYEKGKIKDQDIIIEERKDRYDDIYETFGAQKVYPIIKMKDGECIEETLTVFDDPDYYKNGYGYSLFRIVKTDKGFTRYYYGRDMLKGINWYTNLSSGLLVTELDTKMQFNGIESFYKTTEIPFDTTYLKYRATYRNGIKNGYAYLFPDTWDLLGLGSRPNQGGWLDVKIGKAMMECNYVDGLLNGVAKFKDAESGHTYVEATYKNGLLHGKYLTYYLPDAPNLTFRSPFCEESKNNDIFQIGIQNSTFVLFKEKIPMLKNEGHTILTDGEFKFYEATYVNGIITGNYNYYHSNGKKLYEGTVADCKEIDWKWFDANGKVIYDKKEEDLRLQEEQKKKEEFLNTTVVNCFYCNNPVKLNAAISTGGGCSCFNEYGEQVGVIIGVRRFFDSRKCQIEYEKDCCRQSGYRFEK